MSSGMNVNNTISVPTSNTNPGVNVAPPASHSRMRQVMGAIVGGAANLVLPGSGGAISSLIGGNNFSVEAGQMAFLAESKKMNMEMLGVQSQMNSESRRFETISNVLKARHDAAMSAVRNIK